MVTHPSVARVIVEAQQADLRRSLELAALLPASQRRRPRAYRRRWQPVIAVHRWRPLRLRSA
jgi:hypothetical protein